MKCSKFHRIIPGYLYGELAGKEKNAFLLHSRECSSCSGLLREMENTVRILRSEPSPEFSPDDFSLLRRRVRIGISRKGVQPRPGDLPRRFHVFSPSLARIAAVILVLLTGVLLYSRYLTPPAGVPAEVEEVVRITRTIETEDSEVSEICGEIQKLESLFPPSKGNGSEAWLPRAALRA